MELKTVTNSKYFFIKLFSAPKLLQIVSAAGQKKPGNGFCMKLLLQAVTGTNRSK